MKKIKQLILAASVIEAFGNYIEFKMYEESLKYEDSYEDVIKLKELASIIINKDLQISDFIKSSSVKGDDLIEAYNNLKHSVTVLEGYGIKNYIELFKVMEDHVLLTMPQYYMSLSMQCNSLALYKANLINKQELKENFVMLSLSGTHKEMDMRLFYKLYSKILESLSLTNNLK